MPSGADSFYFGGEISGPGELDEIAACPVMIVVPMKASRLHQLVT